MEETGSFGLLGHKGQNYDPISVKIGREGKNPKIKKLLRTFYTVCTLYDRII